VVPAVGRIELNNSDFPWAGTGWLIAEGIIVTNRHVADLFARLDRKAGGFVFKPGLVGGLVSSDVDFLEEENRADSAEHPVVSILWMAPSDEADVAFLRVARAPASPPLPKPIDLADDVAEGALIGAIGYPARDPSIPDQAKVIEIFGDDVYDKKRFAPGRVMSVDGNRIKHDCSTLGGNSGSVLLDLKTGKAVGLHHGGLMNDSANLAVTAAHVRTLLANALRREVPLPAAGPDRRPPGGPGVGLPDVRTDAATGTHRVRLHIPVEIVVNVGAPVPIADALAQGAGAGGAAPSFDDALRAARVIFQDSEEVLRVRGGYRFKNGWITDERVVVLEVREKLDFGELRASGRRSYPREILGVGVDVRTAALVDQLEAIGVDLALERPGRPAGYTEPPRFDEPGSPVFLGRIRESMSAVFHVSPDAGFANLKKFLRRTKRTLTATMYEWEKNHVSDVIADVMAPSGRTLRMVTQKKGVGNADATESAVEDMRSRLGAKFKHVWASVRGPGRLIPDSYHIKVASRDGEEVWLSSGNWKESNQPKTATSASVLRNRNREWHAIVENPRLATLFQKYVEFDFRQAVRFPLEDGEAPPFADVELFVPEAAVATASERVPGVTYADELVIRNEELDIQPLLTPDRDGHGDRLFLKTATEMVSRATERLYIQNQSFNLTEDNNPEFDRFFEVVKRKQAEIADVRVIFRDAADFGRQSDLDRQQELIERLKDFGLDVSPDAIRLQGKCHTKGIVVDSKEVLLGSQNLTNGGSLFNRDASLLVRSPKVAKFFEKVFLFDWDNLTHNDADERVGGIRRALPGEETPPGFRRVKLSELVGGD
jgi:S1-C subfamily serine protease